MVKFDAKCIYLLAITIGMSFAYDSKILDITQNQVRDVGKSVNLSCTVAEGETPFWFKRSRDGAGDPNMLTMGNKMPYVDPRFNVSVSGNTYTLSIKDIVLDDTGIYECQLIISASQKDTKQVELLIRRAPVVTDIEITPSPVPVGNSAQLKCIAEGYPRPTIYWSRGNDKLLPGGGNKVAKIDYKIDTVTKEDRGLYYCTAENGVGAPVKRSVNFEVEFAPSISVPRPKVAQALDYNIELECRVEAYPAPTVVWFKNDLPIHDSSDYGIINTATINEVTTSILRVITVEPSQYGDYVCKASNKVGSAEARINLFEQPYPNINFSGLQWSSSTTVIFHHIPYIFNYLTILIISMIFV